MAGLGGSFVSRGWVQSEFADRAGARLRLPRVLDLAIHLSLEKRLRRVAAQSPPMDAEDES
jgi:hypothetical protein